MLLLHLEPLLPEPVNESVFINLLQMSVPMVSVDSEPRFANHVAELHDVLHITASFISFCAFCAFWRPIVCLVKPNVFLSCLPLRGTQGARGGNPFRES